jgi:bifunctional non-homologous end joining protein LigD
MGRSLVGLEAMAPSSLPTVNLMHPTLVARPFHHAGWIYEEKVDGWRLVAIKGTHGVRLMSRKGHDLTERFPELVTAFSGLKPRAFILDGEVAVYDRAFISRFEWLRRRPTDEPATLSVYMAFDVLELDGRHLRREPLKVRQGLLERWVRSHGMIFAGRRLSRNGLKAWEEALTRGFEGIAAKNPESRYVPGRTLAWLKVKVPHYREGKRGWEAKGKP